MFPLQDNIPSRRVPVVTYLLILANSVVFLFELSLSQQSLERLLYVFGVVPARFSNPAWGAQVGFTACSIVPFFTSMFLHGGWLHIIANMWTLWIFGDNVEDRMGHLRFLIFYLLCGVLGSILHVLTNLDSPVPTIGASGAIAGVLGAYFLLFPLAGVLVVFPVFFWPLFFELPAVLYLGFWFLSQFFAGTLSLVATQNIGNVAWWAHVGGFFAGMALIPIFTPRRKPRRPMFADEYGTTGAWFNF